MEPAEAVLKFLRSVGPHSEAEFYLQLFRRADRHAFAALVVDGATLAQSADAVALDLRFLTRLELFPVVVVGLMDAEAASHCRQLQAHLQAIDVEAAGPFAPDETGAIAQASDRSQIALVCPRRPSLQDRVPELADLIATLKTRKLIFLRQDGGLRIGGQRVSVVNLSTDTPTLLANAGLSEDDRSLLSTSQKLALEHASEGLVVSMTSPINLLHELFTVRGAGTLLRRGAVIERHVGLAGVDRPALIATLEASFGRKPNHALVERTFTHCYVADAYRGVALLSPCPFGGYLDKFAVTAEARGEGIGRDLWVAILADYPSLLWRARPGNPIAGWYEQQCEARWNRGAWTVYMRGISPQHAQGAIDFAIGRDIDV